MRADRRTHNGLVQLTAALTVARGTRQTQDDALAYAIDLALREVGHPPKEAAR